MLPNFENNAVELDKVDKVIREIQSDKDLTFTDIEIGAKTNAEEILKISKNNLITKEENKLLTSGSADFENPFTVTIAGII